jgi:Zn-dependent protease
MINKKEGFIISIIIIVLTLSISLFNELFSNWYTTLGVLLAVSIIVLTSVFAKKIIAYLLDSEIEMRIWDVGKSGFSNGKQTKPFPLGAFLPLISSVILIPLKGFIWMASLVFDVRPRIYKGAKRFGLYAFSDLTEYHLGVIAAAGIVTNLLFAVAGYFLGFPIFSRLNIYFAFFNMIPMFDLDGNKIFFGSKVLWSILASLVLIGMLFAIFVI